MKNVNNDAVVDTAWLADHLEAPDVRVVDGSYYLPNEGRDARAEYRAAHIPGAVFFDIDEIADAASPLPHMLPASEIFSARVAALGLGDGIRIVVYDQRGMMSAPRVWWTFRVFGHGDVAVLDGGLPKWLREGRAVDEDVSVAGARSFTARQNNLMVRDQGQVRANLQDRREQVLDARSADRFTGAAPEPRAGLRSGHIPGSRNLPYTKLLDPANQTLLPPKVLKERFLAAGLDPNRSVITTCGSGITAAVLALGLHLIGHREVALYDGSWAEWGQPGENPIDTGPATSNIR